MYDNYMNDIQLDPGRIVRQKGLEYRYVYL